MVLMIALLCFIQTTEPSLIEKYKKDVDKLIKKELSCSTYSVSPSSEQANLYEVQSAESIAGLVMVSEVAACHLGGCVAPNRTMTKIYEDEVKLGSEYFDVLVLMTPERKIKKIKILNYFSDYGYEVSSKRYLNKYKGKQVCDFKAGNDEIDCISGATISSMALEGILGTLCRS